MTILEQNLLENATTMGEHWNSKLEQFSQKYSFVNSPRGMGLMRAVNIEHNLAPIIVQKALGHGLLLNNLGPDTLRMVPPLILTKADIDEAIKLLDTALGEIRA